MKKTERVKRQEKYIQEVINCNVVQKITNLNATEQRQLYKAAKERHSHNNQTSIENHMINIQCNKEIEAITKQELDYIKLHKLKPSTLVYYVQEYRKLIKQHLPTTYLQLQREYKIKRKQILNNIQSKNLHAADLEEAIENIPNHPILLSLNHKMQIIREDNPSVRNLQIALYKMSAGKNTHNYLKKQTQEKKIKQQQGLDLIDHKRFLEIAESLINIKNDEYINANNTIKIHRLIMGICALTGRRQIEVIRLGKFEYNGSNSLAFSGQAKTQDIQRNTIEIPVLTSARKLLIAHKQLKIACAQHPLGQDNLTNKQINGLLFTQSQTRGLIKRTFQSIYPADKIPQKISLRSIYGDIAYELFKPLMSKTQYLQQILGHSSTTSADAYIKNAVR